MGINNRRFTKNPYGYFQRPRVSPGELHEGMCRSMRALQNTSGGRHTNDLKRQPGTDDPFARLSNCKEVSNPGARHPNTHGHPRLTIAARALRKRLVVFHICCIFILRLAYCVRASCFCLCLSVPTLRFPSRNQPKFKRFGDFGSVPTPTFFPKFLCLPLSVLSYRQTL